MLHFRLNKGSWSGCSLPSLFCCLTVTPHVQNTCGDLQLGSKSVTLKTNKQPQQPSFRRTYPWPHNLSVTLLSAAWPQEYWFVMLLQSSPSNKWTQEFFKDNNQGSIAFLWMSANTSDNMYLSFLFAPHSVSVLLLMNIPNFASGESDPSRSRANSQSQLLMLLSSPQSLAPKELSLGLGLNSPWAFWSKPSSDYCTSVPKSVHELFP